MIFWKKLPIGSRKWKTKLSRFEELPFNVGKKGGKAKFEYF